MFTTLFLTFKNWFKKSGISYSDILHDSRKIKGLIDKEMIDSSNPLHAVIEHPEYAWARVYRESVWTGIEDTFHVLMGNHYDLKSTGSGRKGVLDVLIFPLISRRLIGFSYEYKKYNGLLRFLARFIGYVLEIPRGLLGVLLTIALIPVVAAVHAYAYPTAKAYREKIQTLEAVKIEKAGKASAGPTLLEDPTFKTYRYTTFNIKLEKKNREGIKALLATNTEHILDKLKADNLLEKVQRWITASPDKKNNNPIPYFRFRSHSSHIIKAKKPEVNTTPARQTPRKRKKS